MPIPSGVETVTVTSGEPLTLPDGTLYRGHIRFIAPDLAVVPSDDYTLGGEAVAELVNGEFSITLVPQDATGIAPTGWTYTIIGEFVNAPGWTRYSVLSKNEPNVILSDILDATSLEPALTSSSVFKTEAVKVLGLDTGMLWGGSIDQTATVGVVALNAGAGIIVDYTANTATPTITLVPITSQNITITDLVSPITWLMASTTGAIVQTTTHPTNAQRRTHIQIGAVVINAGDVIIDQSLPVILSQPTNQLYDLMDALGSFNISGNEFFAAGSNLQLAKNGGTVFVRGFNHFAGPTLTNDPHVSTTAAQNPVSIRYVTRVGAATTPTVTSVDPANYDVGGVVTAIGGTGTRSTIQRIYLFPTNDAADQVVIQYGQNIYSTLDAAVAAIPTDTFVQNPNIVDSVLLGYIVMTRTASNLSNTTQARMFLSSKFQGGFATAQAALSLSLLLTGGTMTGTINATLASAATTALASLVTGDTFDRFRRYADGAMEWGSGALARDVRMERTAADQLTLFDDFVIQGTSKAYRFRRGGSALDMEATGVDLLLSNWSGTAFDGTQRSYARLSADAMNTQWAGRFEFVATLYGLVRHVLDGNANTIGFHGATPQAQATIIGSRSDGTALANLLTALAARGDIINNTTA